MPQNTAEANCKFARANAYSRYLISLFFIKFMLNKNKAIVTIVIHAKLSSVNTSALPTTNPLVKFTKCVKGRKISVAVSTTGGNWESGKKVPLSRNMGVISRNVG